MSWKLFRWIWKVESPLYIGMPPSGSLNRCRPYVPARVLWGSVTAELARQRMPSEITNLDKYYEKEGEKIKEHFRFTYLYPAIKQDNNYAVWLPEFDPKNGLQWKCSNGFEAQLNRKFRAMLFSALAGTAIDPDTDSAQEASLHETECIQPYWNINGAERYNPVYLSGYFMAKNDKLLTEINSINTIFAGGDTRYGLGRLQRVLHSTSGTMKDFSIDVDLNSDDPGLTTHRVLAHAEFIGKGMIGAQECLLGWDRGKLHPLHEKRIPFWAPGSINQKSPKAITWKIKDNGTWEAA
jgi:hypothetical protein